MGCISRFDYVNNKENNYSEYLNESIYVIRLQSYETESHPYDYYAFYSSLTRSTSILINFKKHLINNLDKILFLDKNNSLIQMYYDIFKRFKVLYGSDLSNIDIFSDISENIQIISIHHEKKFN